MALCCRKACVLHRAASCLSAGLFCNMTAVNSRSSADHCPGCSNVGGTSRTIDMSKASIFLPLRGGCTSAISMIVIPSDQMSAFPSYPSSVANSRGTRAHARISSFEWVDFAGEINTLDELQQSWLRTINDLRRHPVWCSDGGVAPRHSAYLVCHPKVCDLHDPFARNDQVSGLDVAMDAA